MEISSTEARNNFGRYLKLARFEEIIITKNGKRAAVIMVICDTENISKTSKSHTNNTVSWLPASDN